MAFNFKTLAGKEDDTESFEFSFDNSKFITDLGLKPEVKEHLREYLNGDHTKTITYNKVRDLWLEDVTFNPHTLRGWLVWLDSQLND